MGDRAATKITGVRDVAIAVASPMRNAKIDFSKMTCSLVGVTAVHRGRTYTGFGFTSNGRYAQSGLLRERFIPRLLEAAPEALADESGDGLDPTRVRDVLMQNEKPGGHGERSVAVGALEMATWDLAAKIAGMPGYQFIARRYGRPAPRDRVVVYAAGGYYRPDGTLQDLRDEIRRFIDLGYPVVKMKIGGASLDVDMERVGAAVDEASPDVGVAVDANGGMDVETAIAYGHALGSLGVRWFEEPVDPLDYLGLAAVAAAVSVPISTAENLFSTWDVRNLLLFGGLDPATDILQMDPVLGYGLAEYKDMLDIASGMGWSMAQVSTHGGHHLSLAATAAFDLGPCEVYPTRFQPFGVVSESSRIDDGMLPLPDLPGLGLEGRPDLAALLEQVRL